MPSAAVNFYKANTFMASQGRLDDARMLKVKEVDGNDYVAGTFSVLERERMLGYPEGYVENAGEKVLLALARSIGIAQHCI